MATTNEERVYIVPSFDAGMQRRASKFLTVQAEIYFGKNIDLQNVLGAISKSLGYQQLGGLVNTYTTTSTSTSTSSSSTTSSSTTTA